MPAAEKMARLFGFLVIRDVTDKEEQALMLAGAGFNPTEVSEMLQVNKNFVNVAKYRKKAGGPKKVRKNS